MQQLSSKELVTNLMTLPNCVWDPILQSSSHVSKHQTGELYWSLLWKMELRDNRMRGDEKPIWQYRLALNIEFNVNKEDAALDLNTVSSENLENAKSSLEMLKITGPIIAGASAYTMKQFENGKKYLWNQIQLMQCYYADMKILQEEGFNTTVDTFFPDEFKKLILDQE